MKENSKISAKTKRVLLFSVFIIPTVLCFAFYIFMIRKPFLENPAGLYKKLSYYIPEKVSENRKDTIFKSLPDFSGIDENGNLFTNENVDQKIFVASFICTSCAGSCSKISAQFFRMQKKLSYLKAFKIVSFTVFPDLENSSDLKNYARLVHANPDYWKFVACNKSTLINMMQNGLSIKMLDNKIEHQNNIYLIDKARHIRGIYDGQSTEEINRLMDEVKVLDAEYRVAKRNKN